ncbi:MAG: hypothetical protein EP341_00255, partial [Sphingomonadales bacterium]
MPFRDNASSAAPFGLPEGFDLNPDQEERSYGAGDVIGAAFRRENPIVSRMNSYAYAEDAP